MCVLCNSISSVSNGVRHAEFTILLCTVSSRLYSDSGFESMNGRRSDGTSKEEKWYGGSVARESVAEHEGVPRVPMDVFEFVELTPSPHQASHPGGRP